MTNEEMLKNSLKRQTLRVEPIYERLDGEIIKDAGRLYTASILITLILTSINSPVGRFRPVL